MAFSTPRQREQRALGCGPSRQTAKRSTPVRRQIPNRRPNFDSMHSSEAMTVIPHPGGVLACEQLDGGGGKPTGLAKRELMAQMHAFPAPTAMDCGSLGIDYYAQTLGSIRPELLAAHKMALEAQSQAEANMALERAGNGPCPQAHIILAEESRSIDEALEHYGRASLAVDAFWQLLIPRFVPGDRVAAVGLVSRPELVGREGIITIAPDHGQDRYAVQLSGETKPMLIRERNLVETGTPVDDEGPVERLARGRRVRSAAVGSPSSLWSVVLTRPFFRAHLGVANCARKLGRFETALKHYMRVEAVDGEHWSISSSYANYRFFVPSTLLLMGRVREARRYILESPVLVEAFTYSSLLMSFCLNLALAEFIIAAEEGRTLRQLLGSFSVDSLPRQPEKIFGRIASSHSGYAAALQYLFDPAAKLPDLLQLPPSVGAPGGQPQAIAYLSHGILELWRQHPGAIDLLKQHVHTVWALEIMRGPDDAMNTRPENLLGLEKIEALERLCAQPGVFVQRDPEFAKELVAQALYFPEQRRAVAAILGVYGRRFAAIDSSFDRTTPTPLCMAMYYDAAPPVVALLVRAGATLWWDSLPAGDSCVPCPLRMATNQGSWRSLAVALALVTSLSTPERLKMLADSLFNSSCLHCKGGNANCPRCQDEGPPYAPSYGHSSHASFQMCADVLVYFGLRTAPDWMSLPDGFRRNLAAEVTLVAEAGVGEDHPRLQQARDVARLVERFRGRLATAGWLSKPDRCMGCLSVERSECQKCACRHAYYCGSECQTKHWKMHKSVCRKRASERIEEVLREAGIEPPGAITNDEGRNYAPDFV